MADFYMAITLVFRGILLLTEIFTDCASRYYNNSDLFVSCCEAVSSQRGLPIVKPHPSSYIHVCTCKATFQFIVVSATL